MTTTFKILTLLALSSLTLTSCGSDDDDSVAQAPVISEFLYGEGSAHSDDRIGYKGSDLHIEAEILAEATVSSIVLEIHAHDLSPGEGEVEWDYEHTYTDATYQVINASFHEHVDIPTNIPVGEYHVELTVMDAQGNSTVAEGHVDIMNQD